MCGAHRFSLILNPAKYTPVEQGLSQDAARSKRFLDQADQFVAREIEASAFGLSILSSLVFGDHWRSRGHPVVGFDPIPTARFKQFSHFVFGKNFGAAE